MNARIYGKKNSPPMTEKAGKENNMIIFIQAENGDLININKVDKIEVLKGEIGSVLIARIKIDKYEEHVTLFSFRSEKYSDHEKAAINMRQVIAGEVGALSLHAYDTEFK